MTHPASPRLATLVAGLLLSGCMTATARGLDDELFDRYEVVTGAGTQKVLPGHFLGGDTAELAVLQVDENGDRRLRLYGFDGAAWGKVLDAALGRDALFVDVATIAGHDRLLTYRKGRLSWFDPDTATERLLVEVAASYRATDASQIPHVDVTRDLNHDGRDDVIVPDVDGFWVATQSSDGSFTEAVKLGPPEPFAESPVGGLDVGEPAVKTPRTYGEVGITAMTVPIYLSRVHEMDFDQDGLSDLAFWNRDHFEVHLQEPSGRFSATAVTFTPAVSLDSDGAYSRAFEYVDQGMLALLFGVGEKSERRVLHSLRDLNGDGVADLVVLTLTGPSLTRQRSVYAVHRGVATPAGTVFEPDAAAVIRPRGKAGGLEPWGYASQRFEDLDGDGQVDLVFRSSRTGVGGMARALVGNSVPLDLEVYRMQDGSYPDEPTARRKIRRFAPFAGPGNIFFPSVLTGDVNGDGRSDLVVGHGPRKLHVFLGVPGPELLASRPRKVEASLPFDERNTWLVDLNRDGKQDVLMHRAPKQPSRVTVLIAR